VRRFMAGLPAHRLGYRNHEVLSVAEKRRKFLDDNVAILLDAYFSVRTKADGLLHQEKMH
jgi:hypothetical protein